MEKDEGGDQASNKSGRRALPDGPWASIAKSVGVERIKLASDRLLASADPVRRMHENWSIPAIEPVDYSEIDIPENPTFATNELLERMIEAGVNAEAKAQEERKRAHKARVVNAWLTGLSALGAVLAALFAGIALWG